MAGEIIVGTGDYPLDRRWTAGRYALHFTSAGNLEFWSDRSRVPIWQSGTHGFDGIRLSLQSDANLVIYDKHHKALWAAARTAIRVLTSRSNPTVRCRSARPTTIPFSGSTGHRAE